MDNDVTLTFQSVTLDEHRAVIAPVAVGTPRPLWSVMIPTYNCARYLGETLASVLRQDPGADIMQIEVVDDHSSDDPAAVVAAVGQGRVGFFQQPRNVGHTTNFATCLNRSRGQLIHLLHGDDYVRDGFYEKMQQAFAQQPTVGAAFCRQIFMDERGHWRSFSPLEQATSGILDQALDRLAVEQRIMTPSIVVRRAVYERLGGFDHRLICSEDWEMWVRIAANYPIWYEVEPLAVYRMHNDSNTGRHIRTGEDTRYTRLAIAIFSAYLPVGRATTIIRQARDTYACVAVDRAYMFSVSRDFPALTAQLREAFLLSRSPRVVRKMMRVLIHTIMSTARAMLSAATSGSKM